MSAFAERIIRSLKIVVYKHLEKKCSYYYVNKLHDFVDIIYTRVNRVTGLAQKRLRQDMNLICFHWSLISPLNTYTSQSLS